MSHDDYGPSRLHLPGQAPPPDYANPVQVQNNPTNGETIVRHLNGSEVVFMADGAIGIRVKSGNFLQLLPNGVIKLVAAQLQIVSEQPILQFKKQADGTTLIDQVMTENIGVIKAPNSEPPATT